MEAEEFFAEIYKRVSEINQLIKVNHHLVTTEHKFGIFYDFFYQAELPHFRHISNVFGNQDDIVGSMAMFLIRKPQAAELILKAVSRALNTASRCPDVAEEIKNAPELD